LAAIDTPLFTTYGSKTTGCSTFVASVIENDKVFFPTRIVSLPLAMFCPFIVFYFIADTTLAIQTASSPAAITTKKMLTILLEICISAAKLQNNYEPKVTNTYKKH
jgi:hypothetical protein